MTTEETERPTNHYNETGDGYVSWFKWFLIQIDMRHSWFCRTHLVTLWLFNIAMENGPFIYDFPIEPSIYKGFSMAM